MKIQILANSIEAEIYVGICDFEYLKPQKVFVNVSAWGNIISKPQSIYDCLDYSKVCSFVKSWEQRPHTDLLETLLLEVLSFCFSQDQRIDEVEAEILKPDVIAYASSVGIKMKLTRAEFESL